MPDSPETSNEDAYLGTVVDFTFSGEDTGSSLTVLYQNVRILIDISLENLKESSSITDQYMAYLEIARNGGSGDFIGPTVEDFFAWILRGCATRFTQLASPLDPLTASLHDCIHPKTFNFALHANKSDEFTLIQTKDTTLGMGARVPEPLSSPWRSFTPLAVKICANPHEEILSSRKVKLDGPDLMFFKAYRYCDSHLAKRELTAYKKIASANLGELKISKLHGLVQEGNRLFGLLLSYIDGQPLTHAIFPDTPHFLRQRWAKQITRVVTRLHEAGLVWGDVKPDNVLIDASDDAWVIDFGGGNTEGWVDSDLAETKEGDLQGLCRIVEFLSTSAEATS